MDMDIGIGIGDASIPVDEPVLSERHGAGARLLNLSRH
jgi:hypothetical protein